MNEDPVDELIRIMDEWVDDLAPLNRSAFRSAAVAISRRFERLRIDEDTLQKVYAALEKAGITEQQAIDAVNQMLDLGILFRERI